MSRPPGTRYPFAPLDAVTGWSAARWAAAVGTTQRTIVRWRADGVPEARCDQLAVAAGEHPATIWPAWMDAQIAAATAADTARQERRRAAARERQRRRYQEDPEYAAAQRARRRAYYAEAGAAERQAEQRRYWTDPERKRAARRDRYQASKAVPA